MKPKKIKPAKGKSLALISFINELEFSYLFEDESGQDEPKLKKKFASSDEASFNQTILMMLHYAMTKCFQVELGNILKKKGEDFLHTVKEDIERMGHQSFFEVNKRRLEKHLQEIETKFIHSFFDPLIISPIYDLNDDFARSFKKLEWCLKNEPPASYSKIRKNLKNAFYINVQSIKVAFKTKYPGQYMEKLRAFLEAHIFAHEETYDFIIRGKSANKSNPKDDIKWDNFLKNLQRFERQYQSKKDNN